MSQDSCLPLAETNGKAEKSPRTKEQGHICMLQESLWQQHCDKKEREPLQKDPEESN